MRRYISTKSFILFALLAFAEAALGHVLVSREAIENGNASDKKHADVNTSQSVEYSFEMSVDSKASNDLQSSFVAVTDPTINNTIDSSSKKVKSDVEKLDELIREISEDGKRAYEVNQVDNSFQAAEAVKAKLDFEINRNTLISMRLRSLKRNLAEAQLLAQRLIGSDVVSKFLKDFAIESLDKSVAKVKNILEKL